MKNKITYCKKFVNLTDSTLRSYLGWINRLCEFAEKSRSTEITAKDIEAFRLSIADLSARSHAVAYAAINTIYRKVLWSNMSEEFKGGFELVMAVKPKQPRKLPLPDADVLSKDQILNWLDRIDNPMYHLCASMTYHTGAKLSETCGIRRKNINQNTIRIGRRHIPVPEIIVKKVLRQKRFAYKANSPWFFPSPQNPARHVSPSSLQKILLSAKPDIISCGAGVRVFRASFIVHQLKGGVDPNWLAYLIGLKGPEGLIPYMKITGLL